MMSDLRESGSIEQDADIVSFLYRDDYYDKESESSDLIEIILAKQVTRHGVCQGGQGDGVSHGGH